MAAPCPICCSPHRQRVEIVIGRPGWPDQRVANEFSFKLNSVQNHRKYHAQRRKEFFNSTPEDRVKGEIYHLLGREVGCRAIDDHEREVAQGIVNDIFRPALAALSGRPKED